MFATYDQHGVRLAFPENWLLEEDSDPEARLHLTLSSPNTAFWSLIVYPEVLDLPHVLDEAVGVLRKEYPDLESQPAEEQIAGHTLAGRDVNFICLDLTSTARLRACHRGASTYLLLCQAEDRELPHAQPVFDAITQSLLDGPPREGAAAVGAE
ncbi:hypothetical protein [Botrimarina sp.]|uniref:hypothetical protein n=1 Tax=Botrimarina sp. TaxID=2795802 RepID=UPI0032EB52CA